MQPRAAMLISNPFATLPPGEPTSGEKLCCCTGSPAIKLMTALTVNPIHCLDCNLEVNPGSLPLTRAVVDAIAAWRAKYDALYALWLASGSYEARAAGELSNIDSQVNREGRAVQRMLNLIRRCYYWYHPIDTSLTGSACPSCGATLRS